MPDTQVKILFRFFSDILDGQTSETMWAEVIDIERGYYKLNNIPFYAPLISSGDILFAEFDEDEKMLTYRKTIEFSGNSTIHVIMMDDNYEINKIRKFFEKIGCPSERYSKKYFALEIPFNIDYAQVKPKLVELEEKEIIGYAETCLSKKHRI